jgi:hypothetical protein
MIDQERIDGGLPLLASKKVALRGYVLPKPESIIGDPYTLKLP